MLWMHESILGFIYQFNLNLEILLKLDQTGNSTVSPFSVIENIITIQWWIFYVVVKTIFELKFDS
jgi:hypothetical protein